jgi:hypothetical protein
MTDVLFITREGCLLCAEALVLVEEESERRGYRLTVADVDREGWQPRFGDRVPVLLRDGAEVLSGHFDRMMVRRALR